MKKWRTSFETPFMIQSRAKSMKKIVGALQDLPANYYRQSSHNLSNWAGLAVLLSWQLQNGSQDFNFSIVMGSKPSFQLKFIAAYVLQFFSLISDSLGSVISSCQMGMWRARIYKGRIVRQLSYYVSLIRACNKVLYQLVYIDKKFVFLKKNLGI